MSLYEFQYFGSGIEMNIGIDQLKRGIVSLCQKMEHEDPFEDKVIFNHLCRFPTRS